MTDYLTKLRGDLTAQEKRRDELARTKAALAAVEAAEALERSGRWAAWFRGVRFGVLIGGVGVLVSRLPAFYHPGDWGPGTTLIVTALVVLAALDFRDQLRGRR